ncbi:hypothetical protein KIN20_006675 [Parelaphostrongylus tenuis]|uniref:Uncharacterized protein n=1 Tax=Parelaphostrongylus tenuis TaxID=148309 RepID=A0AAD5M6F5_PARTN|nr:hypothetical protein KIN20_006675 [Parelaphostrongylus tenuis]
MNQANRSDINDNSTDMPLFPSQARLVVLCDQSYEDMAILERFVSSIGCVYQPQGIACNETVSDNLRGLIPMTGST